MKLQVLQQDLSKALSWATRFASQKAQLPVLGNILLSTKKTKLLVSSTNLETSIAIFLGAKVEKEGEITIPAKVINDLVLNLKTETLSLEAAKEQLKISGESFSSTISGMNSSDFPKVPSEIDKSTAIPLSRNSFLSSLSQVFFAVSFDETRPTLTGVLFIVAANHLTLVATDGFRLSQKKMTLSFSKKKTPTQIIIPKSILSEITRIPEENEEILFSFSDKENNVVFGLPDTIISSRVLEGEFPNFEKIIPKASGIKILLDKEDFLRSVKLASVFARDSANVVKIKIGKDSLGFFAESSSAGSQENKIDAKVEGDPELVEGLEIAFNYRFLEDFLHVVVGDEVEMKLNDAASPAIFKDPKDPDFLHLIMPVRIQT